MVNSAFARLHCLDFFRLTTHDTTTLPPPSANFRSTTPGLSLPSTSSFSSLFLSFNSGITTQPLSKWVRLSESPYHNPLILTCNNHSCQREQPSRDHHRSFQRPKGPSCLRRLLWCPLRCQRRLCPSHHRRRCWPECLHPVFLSRYPSRCILYRNQGPLRRRLY